MMINNALDALRAGPYLELVSVATDLAKARARLFAAIGRRDFFANEPLRLADAVARTGYDDRDPVRMRFLGDLVNGLHDLTDQAVAEVESATLFLTAAEEAYRSHQKWIAEREGEQSVIVELVGWPADKNTDDDYGSNAVNELIELSQHADHSDPDEAVDGPTTGEVEE